MHKRVRHNSVYTYAPVLMDRLHPPVAVQEGRLKPFDRVRVYNEPGCPRCNTMGMAHIRTLDDRFAGLVCTNSLLSNAETEEMKADPELVAIVNRVPGHTFPATPAPAEVK